MQKFLAFLAVSAVVPTFANADLLDRYETAMERFQINFTAFYISRIPELEGNMPPTEWEDIDRDIGRCVLKTYEAATGAAGVEAFVIGIEALAAVEVTSNRVITAAMAPVMADTVANAAVESCGQNDRTNEILARTGMIAIISDPENQVALNAE